MLSSQEQFSIQEMCRVLNVSRSGFYAFQACPQSGHTKRDILLKTDIQSLFNENAGRYDSPRIYRELRATIRKKNGGHYKRIRRCPRREPEPTCCAHKVECLCELEALSERGLLDLFYGDESGVWGEPCVPYGWQWNDEKVFMPSEKGLV